MDSQQFIRALRSLEEDGQIEPMIRLFAEDAELWNPEVRQPLKGQEGVRRFWEEYRDTFEQVHSEFRSVIESDGRTALEWETNGTLQAGQSRFSYGGVSILEWENGRITRFSAYFDPTKLRAEGKGRMTPGEADRRST